MIDLLAQLVITLFGGAAIYLVGRQRPDVRRWGFVCGLIAQPAWYVTLGLNGQWLMMPVAGIYTWAWISGLRNHWRMSREGQA